MKSMTKIFAVAAVSLCVAMVGCGDDEGTTAGPSGPGSGGTGGTGGSGGTGGGTGGSGGMADPPPPTLGPQVDRMGRAAIATALQERFAVDESAHDAGVDDWNANAQPDTWATNYVPSIVEALGVYDALDEQQGNQVAYGLAPGATDPTCPDDGPVACYGTLATVLANDWIVIYAGGDTTIGPQYLGVEGDFVDFEVTGVIDPNNTGGRHVAHDSILLSYTALSGAIPFDDGVTGPTPATSDTFPYLADPL